MAIAALMAIVVTSYRQTVRAYPQGGGAFLVANDNLGLRPAMVAAASLLTDYVLTVAVSISAGVAAITSAAPATRALPGAAGPGLPRCCSPWPTCGVSARPGALFAGPTYAFVVIVGVTLGTGFVRCLGGLLPPGGLGRGGTGPGDGRVSILLILRAFASGASALTGVEAIADGVQAFRPPKSHNAATDPGDHGGHRGHHVPGHQHPGPPLRRAGHP